MLLKFPFYHYSLLVWVTTYILIPWKHIPFISYFLNILMANLLQAFFPYRWNVSFVSKGCASMSIRISTLHEVCTKGHRSSLLSIHATDSFPLVSFQEFLTEANIKTRGFSLDFSPAMFYLLHIQIYNINMKEIIFQIFTHITALLLPTHALYIHSSSFSVILSTVRISTLYLCWDVLGFISLWGDTMTMAILIKENP